MRLTDKEYLQINQALFTLTHAYESKMDKGDPRNLLNLKLSDCSVLMVLHQFAPMTSTQLSEVMDINPGTISVYVQRLLEMGLVDKKQDPANRRKWWLTLTGMGKTAGNGVVATAAEYTREFLVALNEEEQKTLHALLQKASHSLGFNW